MTSYWVSNGCGALFIFHNVVLDPNLDSTDAFEDWYILNNIEKITKASPSCILWGELSQKIQEIKPDIPWETEF